MIKIENLNKFYNPNKPNEIHVINDTTLEFPNTGLICLLGPSGSGKTTLLNVIGGLDRVDSGKIKFKDYRLSKYQTSKWDVIRNNHFGYIFQNYYLLPDLTVYENLELVLKMLGLGKDKIDERIDYALTAVGMYKYKKRKPNQLSGGQQQRIAIARALVKSPDVVIADEPTGNLDEKNTTQIMNIIKKISKDCLVILVTHERRLAEFYGDRIIEISDGKIIADVINSQDRELISKEDHNLYLKEYENSDEIVNDDLDVKYYYSEPKKRFRLNVIFKDDTFYITSPLENVKIKFLDRNSEIQIVDSNKPRLDKQHIENFEYHLSKLESKKVKNKSVISFKDAVKFALKHLSNIRRRQKLMFIVMFFASILLTVGFINFFTATQELKKHYKFFNENVIVANANYDEVLDLIGEDDLVLDLPRRTVVTSMGNSYFAPNDTIQFINIQHYAMMSAIPIDIIDNPTIYNGLGRLIENKNEVLIDYYLVEKFLELQNVKNSGLKYPEQFLGLKLNIDSASYIGVDERPYEIVGIVNYGNPNIYLDMIAYKNVILTREIGFSYNSFVYSIDQIEAKYYYLFADILEEENQPDDLPKIEKQPIETLLNLPRQVVINNRLYAMYDEMDGIEKIDFRYDMKVDIHSILEFYEEDNPQLMRMYVSEDITNDFYEKYLKNQTKGISIYSKNPKRLMKTLKKNDIEVMTYLKYESDFSNVMLIQRELIIPSIVILIASSLFLYFLMRSSLFSRIYEVGVYRALGISKFNLYKMFFTEIFLITFITSFFGVLGVSLFVIQANKLGELIFFPFYIPLISFGAFLLINTFVGLLPVNKLLRLFPAEILSKYDI